ncbi:hypothetical protein BMS_3175 [Halobacteriovorax marinus SJ]|uniref:HEXXH motif domain-containing protein n=1 Tax=Halobacteriovorax marinus (strain ATCC BAA-682 / DSM 15412 / SJ) TaxID=862908 RepID=E1WZZ3_HALMS|nr:HEXXH motif-containing putative peptide modification protein [Halobacteriovorax marinus]CBW27929.1 hypothetical protein BMS_3175 [Halobacteriovorax marinus SJ]
MSGALDSWIFKNKFEKVRATYAKALMDKFNLDFLASAPLCYLSLLYYGDLSFEEIVGINDFYKKRVVNLDVSTEFEAFWNRRINIVSESLTSFRGDASRFNLDEIINEISAMDDLGFDLNKHLRFCLVSAPNFRGASHPHSLFCLYLNFSECENKEDVIKSIVHEIAHQELFLLNLEDRLVLEGSDEELRYAPFQRKERPPIGRLHSAHVMFRLIMHQDKFKYKLENERELLRQTIETFDRSQLTEFGMKLVYNYRGALEN